MLHFVTRTVDWLEKTVFRGASLPSWMTSVMSKRLAAILLILCGLGFGAVMGWITIVLMGTPWQYWPFGLGYAIVFGTIFWWIGIVLPAGDVRKSWQNRRKYTYFYCPSDHSLKDCVVKREIGESFSSGNGILLLAWPESRLFGKIRWGIDAKPEGIMVRFKAGVVNVCFEGERLAIGDEWLALIFEAMLSSMSRVGWCHIGPQRFFSSYHSRSRERQEALQKEIHAWMDVLSASKRASGSQELGRLRERIEHVLKQLGRGEFVDFHLGAPELIFSKRFERKKVAGGGEITNLTV